MASSSGSNHPSQHNEPLCEPLFSVEIELFLKLRSKGHLIDEGLLSEYDVVEQPWVKLFKEPVVKNTESDLVKAAKTRMRMRFAAEYVFWKHNINSDSGQREIPSNIREGVKPKLNYKHWALVDDRSVLESNLDDNPTHSLVIHDSVLDPHFWRVELVSPILDSRRDWEEHLKNILALLNKYFHLQVTDKCGFHVHVTPNTPMRAADKEVAPFYTADQIYRIIVANVFWEDCLLAILPESRRAIIQNTVNREVLDIRLARWKIAKDLETWREALLSPLKRIKQQKGIKGLIDFIITRKGYGKLDFTSMRMRHNTINYCNVLLYEKGTLEYRLFPGTKDPVAIMHYIRLTLSMHAAALHYNWDNIGIQDDFCSSEMFWGFMEQGMGWLPNICRSQDFQDFKSWYDGEVNKQNRPLSKDQQKAVKIDRQVVDCTKNGTYKHYMQEKHNVTKKRTSLSRLCMRPNESSP